MSEDKQITISEFLMWLEGVEEMQEDDWSPDKRQWSRIRAKLNCITTPAPQQVVQQNVVQYRTAAQQPTQQTIPQVGDVVQMDLVPRHEGPVTLSAPGLMNVQPERLGSHAMFGSDTPGILAKTPDIDTSGGDYKSSFL
jgi:hypothetical protein